MPLSLNTVYVHDCCIFMVLTCLLPALLHVPFFFSSLYAREERQRREVLSVHLSLCNVISRLHLLDKLTIVASFKFFSPLSQEVLVTVVL